MIRAVLAGIGALALGLIVWAIALEVRRDRRAKRVERCPDFYHLRCGHATPRPPCELNNANGRCVYRVYDPTDEAGA